MFPSFRSSAGVAYRCAITNFQRFLSQKAIQTLSYSQVIDELKSDSMVLIDVREREEIAAEGKISTSNNIPCEVVNALQMSDLTFKTNYGFIKPVPSDNIVVHCKKGVRATDAANEIIKAGFRTVKVYPGINDWLENGGKLEK